MEYKEIKSLIEILQSSNEITEAWVFALFVSKDHPLEFNKKDSRFLKVTKVKIIVYNEVMLSRVDLSNSWEVSRAFSNYVRFVKYNKNGTLSKTSIPYDKFGYTPLSLFFNEIDALNAYDKESVKAHKVLSDYQEKVIKKIADTKDKILYNI